jgi:hypothetical protein
MRDVRIGLTDGSYLHFIKADIRYLPAPENPVLVRIKSLHVELSFPYEYVEYIKDNWG